MSRKDKLAAKLLDRKRDTTWDELTSLLQYLGYREAKKGKTGGSRRRFVHESGSVITLHKPYPQNVVKRYATDQVIEILRKEGLL
ncbi:MAG: type II toxin-antitoxin system HicA family toxin [Candidatus Electrothrix aestuarii]|uniref:Type II toxin-antitoxin system HicA family toxin n=1 Tax=Candidatus Electrothrix aestuarii TaxID=3062594 RepID=A0AAU8LQY0_9BACT|nr:type II toxin-antitoxin system HicA family toxin [Candidatus Electrothrix aestuarii]